MRCFTSIVPRGKSSRWNLIWGKIVTTSEVAADFSGSRISAVTPSFGLLHFARAFPVALTGFVCTLGLQGGARDEILLAQRLDECEGFLSES